MSKLRWWGYLHKNDTVQVKRYFFGGDLADAFESPFVVRVCGPFEADDRDEAIRIITKALDTMRGEPC